MTILLLVKRPGPLSAPASIHYRDIGDYLSREQKLEIAGKTQFDEVEWADVIPNDQGDWINQRSDKPTSRLRPVAVIQSESATPSLTPLFESSSFGIISRRDSWVFNSSGGRLRELVERQVSVLQRAGACVAGRCGCGEERPDAVQVGPRGRAASKKRSLGRGAAVGVQIRHLSTLLPPALLHGWRANKRSLPDSGVLPHARHRQSQLFVVERGLRVPGRAPAVILGQCYRSEGAK